MKEVKLLIPDIGGSSDVTVAEIYVKVGDAINKDDNLLMLETDKATMEVPAEYSGEIKAFSLTVGDKVSRGSEIGILEVSSSSATESSSNPKELNTGSTAKDNNSNGNIPNRPISMLGDNSSTSKVSNLDNVDLSCDVVVIGAGPGGYTAAFRAADLGKKVVLIEKYSTLGGVCLNVGCIPSKALLHVARVVNEAQEMSHHGVSFGIPNLDIDKIREYKSGVVSKLTNGLSQLAKQRKVSVIQGIAEFSSQNSIKVKTSDGDKIIGFGSAIIAVGSESFKVPGFPCDDKRVIDSTGALAVEDIPEKLLVVGGGVIGLEMAEVYSSLGSKVTVVELSGDLLLGVDRDLVKVLQSRINKRYEAIYINTKCAKVETKKDGVYVTFEGENAPKEPVKFDKILVSAGRKPNGHKVGAEHAGVIVDDKGFIKVDKQCRTNVANIYAIGDVVGQPMLAHKATHEGKVAAENACGIKSFFDTRAIPGVAYTDPEVAWMGITEIEAKAQGIEIEVGKFPWVASGRALGNGRDDGFTKVIVDKKSHKIIGAGIVGINAGELIAETTLALEMGCDIHDVALTIHPHPTLSESVAFACEMIDGSITDLYVPKK